MSQQPINAVPREMAQQVKFAARSDDLSSMLGTLMIEGGS